MDSSDQEINLEVSKIQNIYESNTMNNSYAQSILHDLKEDLSDEEKDEREIEEAQGLHQPSVFIESDDDEIKSVKSLGDQKKKKADKSDDESQNWNDQQKIGSGSDWMDSEGQKVVDQDQKAETAEKAQKIEISQYDQVRPISFKPEQFQMFQNSIDKNSIVFLPTGMGKTLVSMMAMQYYLCKYGKQKKIIFLANTVQLVKQQTEAIRHQLPRVAKSIQLTSFIRAKSNKMHNIFLLPSEIHNYVICLHGEKNDQIGMTKRKMIEQNAKQRKQLKEKLRKGLIIVIITQMFLNCLRRGYIKLSDCMFIVFDECHHCNGEHPFKNILDEFYFDAKRKLQQKNQEDDIEQGLQNGQDNSIPILMGLTASPVLQVHKDVDKIKTDLKNLCNNLNSNFSRYLSSQNSQFNSAQSVIITPIKSYRQDQDSDTQLYVYDLIQFYKTVFNNIKPLELSKKKLKSYLPELYNLVVELEKRLAKQKVTHNAEELFKNLLNFLGVKSVDVWLELGTYALCRLIEDIQKQFGEFVLEREPDKSVKQSFDEILAKHVVIFKKKFGSCVDKNISEKVLTLINILKDQERKSTTEKTKKILVFVFERRIVRYLQKIIESYVAGMKDISEQHRQRLTCRCVTGASDKRSTTKHQDNVDLAENPTNQVEQKRQVKQTYAIHFRHDLEDYRENQGSSIGLKNQRAKKDSRLSKQLGSVNQAYGEQIRTINDFRMNKFPILLTTSVTEEGFDIPHCNIVISFNRPQQLKSFIQIKGRARAKNSKYIILEFEGKPFEKMMRDQKTYESTIQATGDLAIQNISKNYEPILPPRNPYYRAWKPQNSLCTINTNNALQLLMGFVNSNRGLHQNTRMKVYSYYFRTPETGYTCYLKFHDGLPIDIVKGDICPNKRQALKSASYYATVDLYKKGCIKEDLKPKSFAELQGEFELEKVNDFELMMSDTEYAEILQTYARVEEDDSMKRLKLHFKSILNNQFDFPYINPQFKPDQFRTKPFSFQLYRIQISNNNNSLKHSTGVNSNINLSIGLLTCFRSCDTESIFTNFRYNMIPGLNEEYRILLVEESLKLSYEEYMKLKKVHDFIVCSALNHQLILLSRRQPPEVKSWKIKLESKKFDFDQRQFYPLFMMLEYNKTTKKYEISQKTNAEISKYQDKLKMIYDFQNSYQKTKTKTQPTPFPLNLAKEMQEFREQFKPEYSNKYIIQSITNDYMLHKCVVVKHTEQQNLQQTQINPIEKKRQSDLRKMFPHAGTFYDKKINIIILRKILKEIILAYLCPDKTVKQSMEKEERTLYRSEFMKYPLNIDLFVQLKFCIDYVLPKVGDYSRAYHFRNIFLKSLEYRSLENCKQDGIQKYQVQLSQNIILKSFQTIRSHMFHNTKTELKQRASQLINDVSTYKYPISNILDIIEQSGYNNIPEPKSRQNYVIKQVVNQLNINQILRSLTSKIYKSNRTENYEEYEFMGDVVLKMLATIEVFVTKSRGDEGELHLGRANIISNANLRQISIRNKLFLYIMTKPLKQSSPPLKIYYDSANIQSQTYKSSSLLKINSASEQEGFCYIPFKQHADVLEALIGVYYLNNSGYNLDDCQFFLYSMGVLKFPTLMLKQQIPKNIGDSIPQFQIVEERLKHNFVNKNLLVQAFTHKTFSTIVKQACDAHLNNVKKKLESEQLSFSNLLGEERVVESSVIHPHEFYYERLEFLGDSVLDLVAVEYIYEKTKGQMDEGSLSLLKQVSVSNKTLGLIALFWGLDEFILMDSRDTLRQFKQLKERFTILYQNPEEIFTKQAAPLKILGDVLQAYVGAVFLDCQFDYLHTKAICRRMLAPFIDYFTSENLISKHPQYKFKEYLKNNNLQDVRVKKTDRMVGGGKFEYVLVDRAGTEISRCHEVSLKKAEDMLIEIYMDSNSLGFNTMSGGKDKGNKKDEDYNQVKEEDIIVEMRSGE